MRGPARPSLVCDFDSTLWPFNDALHGVVGDAAAHDKWIDWDAMVDLYGSSAAATQAFELAQSYESMRRHGLFAGVHEAFGALNEYGASIVIVTNRSMKLFDAASRFLHDADVRCPVLRLDPAERIALCREGGARLLVDDHPRTLETAHRAGLTAIAKRYPYNAEVVDTLGLASASDWWELREVIVAVLDENAALRGR